MRVDELLGFGARNAPRYSLPTLPRNRSRHLLFGLVPRSRRQSNLEGLLYPSRDAANARLEARAYPAAKSCSEFFPDLPSAFCCRGNELKVEGPI